MKYLVTGGAGFIGSHFVDLLLSSQVKDTDLVIVFDKMTYAGDSSNFAHHLDDPRFKFILGDICDINLLGSNLTEIDTVVNFAAESHVDNSITGSDAFIRTNVTGLHNLLVACKQAGTTRVVNISTDEVYGSLTEGAAFEDSPLLPNSPYASSKAAGDLIARSFVQTYGMDIITTRSCNNYGPRQFPEKVIPVFIQAMLRKEPLPIYGTGKNMREWIHVADNCRAILKIIQQGSRGATYNIGSGLHFSNNELATELSLISGIENYQSTYVEDRLAHDFRYSVNFDKLNKLGYLPEISWKTGLSETFEWYSKHVDI